MPIGETLTGGLEGIKVEAKCPLYPESGHQRSDLMSFLGRLTTSGTLHLEAIGSF